MAKPARRRVDNNVEVTNRDIVCRAFELYCQRGCQDGSDTDDWLRAERELRGAVTSTVRVRGNWAQRLP
jgi:hypothetical protein